MATGTVTIDFVILQLIQPFLSNFMSKARNPLMRLRCDRDACAVSIRKRRMFCVNPYAWLCLRYICYVCILFVVFVYIGNKFLPPFSFTSQ